MSILWMHPLDALTPPFARPSPPPPWVCFVRPSLTPPWFVCRALQFGEALRQMDVSLTEHRYRRDAFCAQARLIDALGARAVGAFAPMLLAPVREVRIGDADHEY